MCQITRYRFNLHTVRYSGRRNVSIIHAVSSFEYFILDSSKRSRFLFFSPLPLSLSRFFRFSSTNIVYPLGEIYHGVKFIFHFGSIKVQSDSATLSGASRAFNFFLTLSILLSFFFFVTLHFLRAFPIIRNSLSHRTRTFRTFPCLISSFRSPFIERNKTGLLRTNFYYSKTWQANRYILSCVNSNTNEFFVREKFDS